MAQIKHNKYKNTGILFELLVRKITADTMSNHDSKAVNLIKKFFVNSELAKENKLYQTYLKICLVLIKTPSFIIIIFF